MTSSTDVKQTKTKWNVIYERNISPFFEAYSLARSTIYILIQLTLSKKLYPICGLFINKKYATIVMQMYFEKRSSTYHPNGYVRQIHMDTSMQNWRSPHQEKITVFIIFINKYPI